MSVKCLSLFQGRLSQGFPSEIHKMHKTSLVPGIMPRTWQDFDQCLFLNGK